MLSPLVLSCQAHRQLLSTSYCLVQKRHWRHCAKKQKNRQLNKNTSSKFSKRKRVRSCTLKKIRTTFKQKHEQKNSLSNNNSCESDIDDQIRTTRSKYAFQLINRLSIVHPTTRDGGIMNCFQNSDDQIVAGQENVLRSCLHQL